MDGANPKGFWRVDSGSDPELRLTVLTLIAYLDLHNKIKATNGDRENGIQSFLTQNHGEGWLVPEALRLADYNLGRDDPARCHQPVASRLGPRSTTGNSPRVRTSLCASGGFTPATCLAMKSIERRLVQATRVQVGPLMTAAP